MNHKTWILIDTETTGFTSPIYVVELAAQKMRGWLPEGPPFRAVLNHNTDIPSEASRVNGYTREILQRDGDPPCQVYSDFADYTKGMPLVAYNLNYELDRVLIPEWERLGIEPIGKVGFCALKLTQRLLDPVPFGNCKLQTLRQYFHLPERGAHSALGDVETVADIMKEVLHPLALNIGLQSWDEIVSYTSAEWFPSRIPFGKFKDRLFIEARDDNELLGWLEWLSQSGNRRSVAMSEWYLQKLVAKANSPIAEVHVNHSIQSECSELVIHRSIELETLRRVIAAARARLADLQAESTRIHQSIAVVESQLFSILRPFYEKRDNLQMIIHFRSNYIDTLLSAGEEAADSIRPEYKKAREESKREYEEAAIKTAESKPLNHDEELELKALFRKLVRLYHPDRFAKDPDKQSIYARLMSEINEARDRGDIALLRQIANDPESYMLKHGLGHLNFEDSAELSKLRELYDSLQLNIMNTIEELTSLRESSGYELYEINLKRPNYVNELAESQSKDIGIEIIELEVQAQNLSEEIESLTGQSGCID